MARLLRLKRHFVKNDAELQHDDFKEVLGVAYGQTERDTDPHDRTVTEEVELLVLSGYPLSGMDRTELDQALQRIPRGIVSLKRGVSVCMLLSVIFWTVSIYLADDIRDMYAMAAVSALTVSIVLILLLVAYIKGWDVTHDILEAREDVSLLKGTRFVTTREVAEGHVDPLLPPLHMTLRVEPYTSPERQSLLSGIELARLT